MLGKNKIYILLLLLCFTILIALEYNKPKPVDWSVSLSSADKIPFGCYALSKLLPSHFSGKITENSESYYEYFNANFAPGSIMFVADRFEPDALDLNSLCNFVVKGGTVFISAQSFSQNIKDTLHFKTSEIWNGFFKMMVKDTVRVRLLNPLLKEKCDSNYFITYHSAIELNDSSNAVALGSQQGGDLNFVHFFLGNGNFYIHTAPQIFTNFYLLKKDNEKYAQKVLSYIPNGNLVWDEYYKTNVKFSSTPMRFILSKPALSIAYYILLAGLLIYFVFESRRRERAVPVIVPPKNTSLEFVETLGRLYLHGKNHKDLITKRFVYFFDFIRNHYGYRYAPGEKPDVNLLSERTGVPVEQIEKLFAWWEKLQNLKYISEDELHRINQCMEDFYKKCI